MVTATACAVCKIYLGSLGVKNGPKLTEILKAELRFVEQGGYRGRPRFPFRPNFIFEDSPTCIKMLGEVRDAEARVCTECHLMEFVPEEHRTQRIPCRYIDLTGNGETVNSFYEYGTEEELEKALVGWLKRKIRELEEVGESQTQGA
jgi:hypothetical protein